MDDSEDEGDSNFLSTLASLTRSANKRSLEVSKDSDNQEVRALKKKLKSLTRQANISRRNLFSDDLEEEEEFNLEGQYNIGPHDNVTR